MAGEHDAVSSWSEARRERAVVLAVRPEVDGGRYPVKRVARRAARDRGRHRRRRPRRRAGRGDRSTAGRTAGRPRRRDRVARDRARARPGRHLARDDRARGARPAPLHGDRVGRRVRHLAARPGAQAGRGHRRGRRAARGRRAGRGRAGPRRARSGAPPGGRGAARRRPVRRAHRDRDRRGAGRCHGAGPRSQPRVALRPRAGGRRRASARARARRGTSCSRARPGATAGTARCATPRRGSTTSPSSASTSCTCRRSIRSAARSARAPTTRRPPGPDDPGSPWAIGGPEGGHTSVHPELGTLADFDHLVAAARDARPRGRARHRVPGLARSPVGRASTRRGSAPAPTARIQYAENPPKKYQDVYPFDFETRRLAGAVGRAARRVRVLVRARRAGASASTTRTPSRSGSGSGACADVQARYPDAIFLAEAFTRPKLMYALAKVGFSPVVHVLHLAHDQGRARRATSTELAQQRGRRVLPAELLADHAGHLPRAPRARRARRRSSSRLVLAAHAVARATGSTARRTSSWSTSRGRAPRSSRATRSTSSAAGTSSAPTACAT